MDNSLLSFFAFCQFAPAYWQGSPTERRDLHERLLARLRASRIHFELYQVFPLRADADLLLWCTAPLSEAQSPDGAFHDLAETLTPFRSHLLVRDTWWGMTRPSDYSRGKSAQEIDPLDAKRSTYLVVYPFSKTAEWYRLSRDTRQGMMNEHIRTGHQYPEITQLLLYSTGLQDQEFIVAYETDDLRQFSTLVAELRSGEARRFTLRDTPVFTAIHRAPEEALRLFA